MTTLSTDMPTRATPAIMKPKTLSRMAALGFQKMAGFRKTRTKLLSHYCGRFYGRSTIQEDRAYPLAMIYQATTTMVPNLVTKDPRADVSATFVPYKPYAQIASLAMDHLVQEIKLRNTLRMVVTDAIFLDAFVKVGLGVSGKTLDIDGWLRDVGMPYADRVDADDMVLDPVARQWDEQRFVGNRFRVDLETVREAGTIDQDKLTKLASRYQNFPNNQDASELSGNMTLQEADGLVESVDLVELWVPAENVIVTMPWLQGNDVADEFLSISEYEGPEGGPYHKLGYAWVPDNLLSVAPAMVWYDLYVMANRVARKAARQAERQKSVLAYESSDWQSAQDIIEAPDGESVRVDNIDAIKEVSYGGAVDDNYQFVAWAKQQFSEMAMNVDLLSGQASNEPTLGQAEMLQANSTVRLGDMQDLVYRFTGEIMEHLFFFLHTDPLIELPLVRRVAGVDKQVVYTPEMREGEWLDYNIKVRPYSMARQDPNVKIRRIMELVSNILPAVANAFQMLGPAFNIEKTIIILGRELGIEDLDEIINSQQLQMMTSVMQQMLEAGVPVDTKVIMAQMGVGPGQAAGASGAAPGGGVRPQQPNPNAQLPARIGPTQERNAMQQETSAELQASY